jgi:hypothetical protein
MLLSSRPIVVALFLMPPAGALMYPPVGASYEGRLNIPLVGVQLVHLHVTTPGAGRITLSGRLNRKSTFEFERSASGAFALEFHPDLKSVLGRYRIEIVESRYSGTDDCAHCRVVIRPVLFNRPVILRRTYGELSETAARAGVR